MARTLTDNEIEEFLRKEYYAHLACCEHVKYPYVVPMTYAYKNKSIYLFSFNGEKIDIMREHPHVAVQVENIASPKTWKSVIAWGEYEELFDEARKEALDFLLEKLWKESVEGNDLFFPYRSSKKALEAAKEGKTVVIYRVNIESWSGHLEEYEQ